MMSTRSTVQLAFLILTVTGVFLLGANAERWCPFGGVEAIYTYINEGNLTCSLAVSNFYILGAVLLSALLLRRVFCGYACPIGALSEWLQKGAKKLGIKPARVPRGLDGFLSLLKYPILAVILYYTWTAGELIFRGFDPCYALLSRHGEDITFWAYVTAGGIVLFSFFITVPFCRWLCPLAAVLNPFSRFGAAKVKRNEEPCTSCRKCAKACPGFCCACRSRGSDERAPDAQGRRRGPKRPLRGLSHGRERLRAVVHVTYTSREGFVLCRSPLVASFFSPLRSSI